MKRFCAEIILLAKKGPLMEEVYALVYITAPDMQQAVLYVNETYTLVSEDLWKEEDSGMLRIGRTRENFISSIKEVYTDEPVDGIYFNVKGKMTGFVEVD